MAGGTVTKDWTVLPNSAAPLLLQRDARYKPRVEFADFHEHARQQLESVIFGWCDALGARTIVEELLARRDTVRIRSRFPVIEHDDTCPHRAGQLALEEAS